MSKWTVYCRDTFDGTTWKETFETEDEARKYASKVGAPMLTCHVDDPSGRLIAKEGSY